MITDTLKPNTGFLLLEDGSVFYGLAAGAPLTKTGEICFNTAMAGYQETFSDPSYGGQILVMTSPHIGNYATLHGEQESPAPTLQALVCRNYSGNAPGDRPGCIPLNDWLSAAGIPVLHNIDTRQLVQKIRNAGSMNALLSTNNMDLEQARAMLASTPSMSGQALGIKAGASEPTPYSTATGKRVALIDFGFKDSMARLLAQAGIEVQLFPSTTPFETLLAWNPDGFLLSNGPGDPEPLTEAIELTKRIIQLKKPVFGICLGHQIIGLSMGLQTFKMKNGHRGVNHPVLNLSSGKGEITSQNHGFAVDTESLQQHPDMELTHRHLNDGTVAGMRHRHLPVFSVQYHPEAAPGPHDSRYLFQQFIQQL
jgi:carbamoyl-phosphate synthase small subunit